MGSTTKRERLYIVQGLYWGSTDWEDLTASADREEAHADLWAYRDNDPSGIFRIRRRTEEASA